jgi:hypothetical protein
MGDLKQSLIAVFSICAQDSTMLRDLWCGFEVAQTKEEIGKVDRAVLMHNDRMSWIYD